MSRRCILHIGPHKTGTSSIQSTLFYELDDPHFEYAKLGVSNHSMIANLFLSDPLRGSSRKLLSERRFRKHAQARRIQRRLDNAISNCGAHNFIISGEGISGMNEPRLERLFDYLGAHFEEFLVLGYARPPRAWMTSAVQQKIKENKFNFPELVKYRQYRKHFEKFDKIFGRQSVRIVKFDPAVFPQGDVVLDFLSATGIRPPATVRRVNESLSRAAVQILYAYHHFGKPLARGPLRRRVLGRVVEIIRNIPSTRFNIASALLEPLLDSNSDDIAWAEARIGASLAEDRGDEAGAIGSEADMFDIAPEAIARLEEIVAARCGLPGRIDEPAPYAARLVGCLTDVVSAEQPQRKRQRRASVAKADDEPVEG